MAVKQELTDQALRWAPAGAGAVWNWLSPSTVVAVATVIYIIIQAAYLLRKWYREEKDWKRRRGAR